jgi:DNA-binding transcriptional LysR family regulator
MKYLDVLTIEDLRLILAIVDEGSLTAGALRMGMSQSNASYALKKIQAVFQADLFVRKGRILVPGEFGWHVYNHISAMLEGFEKIAEPPEFDPLGDFTLRFAATEYEVIAVLPQIMQLLKRHAPKVRIEIVALDALRVHEQVEELDFIFIPSDIRSEKIGTLRVLTDSYVTFYDGDIRAAPASLAEFAAARHAIVSFDGSRASNIDRLLAEHALKRELAMSVFGFAALAGLMRGSDLVSTLPVSFAGGLFSGFATCECPLDIPTMPLFLCWDVSKEENGKLRWFRALLAGSDFMDFRLPGGKS